MLLVVVTVSCPVAWGQCAPGEFIRGDADGNGSVFGLVDAIYTFNYLFNTGPQPPTPIERADINDNGLVEICDVGYVTYYAFAGGAPPPAPFPGCGVDTTPAVGLPAPNPDFQLSLPTIVGTPGDTLSFSLLVSNSEPVNGLSYWVSVDPSVVASIGQSFPATLSLEAPTSLLGRFGAGLVYDLTFNTNMLAPGIDQAVATVDLTLAPGAPGGVYPLEFLDEGLRTNLGFFDNADPQVPVTNDGVLVVANSLYVGPAGGLWSNPAHWSTGVVPTTGDHVYVNDEVLIDASAFATQVVVGAQGKVSITVPGALFSTDVVMLPDAQLSLELEGFIIPPKVVVTGSMQLAGDLEVTMINQEVPGQCELFPLIAGTTSGNFDTSNLVQLPGRRSSITRDPSGVDFELQTPPNAFELPTLLLANGAVGPEYNAGLSIDGAWLVVGEPVDSNGVPSGSVYPHRWVDGGWQVQPPIFPADGGSFDFFGTSNAISGELLAVGAPNQNNTFPGAGAVYLFRWDGAAWLFEEKLLAADPANFVGFGRSVAVEGDVVVVGAASAAYVFRRSAGVWSEEQKLTGAVNGFGQGVSISGDTIAVGSPSPPNPGRIFIFRESGSWTQEAELVAPPVGIDVFFGQTVSLDGDRVLGGAPDSAASFVRNGTEWSFEQQFIAADAVGGDFFGGAVALQGDTAFIGSANATIMGIAERGAAYLFHFDGVAWNETQKLFSTDATVAYGAQVALAGDFAATRSPGPTGKGGGGGFSVAYPYGGATGADCDCNALLDTQELVDGDIFDIDGDAIADQCQDYVLNSTTGVFYPTIADAVSASSDGDAIWATPSRFEVEPDLSLASPITVQGIAGLAQPFAGFYSLGNNATLAGGLNGESMIIGGELRVEANQSGNLNADFIEFGLTSQFDLRPGSSLIVTAPNSTFLGTSQFLPGATLSIEGSMAHVGNLTGSSASLFVSDMFDNSGSITLLQESAFLVGTFTNSGTLQIDSASVLTSTFTNTVAGSALLSGTIFGSVANDGALTCIDNTLVSGDYLNNGTTTIQVGTLNILGSLTDNGTIVGDLQSNLTLSLGAGDPQPVDGVTIEGNYTAGELASLLLPDPAWRLSVGGDFDVAISDNTRFAMSTAQLRLKGAGARTVEAMSQDRGVNSVGLDPSQPAAFPVGTLLVDTGAVVEVVDNHDNDGLGQAISEALYVVDLIVEPGATLNTNGRPIYFETAVIEGTVDDPQMLKPLNAVLFVRGDVNADGFYDISDPVLALSVLFEGTENSCLRSIDANGDFILDVSDAIFMLNGIFGQGPLPSAPFPACGVPSPLDPLTCEEFSTCLN